MTATSRVQPGVPTGGQFAPTTHAESDVELTETELSASAVAAPSTVADGWTRWDGLSENDVVHLAESRWSDAEDMTVSDLCDLPDHFDDSDGIVEGSVRVAQSEDGSLVVAWSEAGAARTTYRGSATEPSESSAGAVGRVLVSDKNGNVLLAASGKPSEYDDAELLSDATFRDGLAAAMHETELRTDPAYVAMRDEGKATLAEANEVLDAGAVMQDYTRARVAGLKHWEAKQLWSVTKPVNVGEGKTRQGLYAVNQDAYFQNREMGLTHQQALDNQQQLVQFVD